jgi:hypothetical protein
MYFYNVYDLLVASELLLPELVPVDGANAADVTISLKPLPETLENSVFPYSGSYFQSTGETCQFLAKGIARYRIEQGDQIFIDRNVLPMPGLEPTDSSVRLYLLGTALGALLHQRHCLPLHVSALATPSGVWAFTGPSGAGKSTLAAWLHHSQGWPLVSDDVAVLKPKDELPYLYSGPPRLKLWQDALSAIGIEKNGLTQDLTRTDKYHLYSRQKFHQQPQPLKALVMLERANTGEAPSLEPIEGMEAFKAVMASIYRPEFGTQFSSPQQLFDQGVRLGKRITVYRYRRSWAVASLDANLQPLIQQMQQAEKVGEKAIAETSNTMTVA